MQRNAFQNSLRDKQAEGLYLACLVPNSIYWIMSNGF